LALALGGLSRARAGQPADEPVVALPPMVVEEEKNLPPWLYVADGGTEYLSRCAERITREYVEMRRDRMAWVRTLIPEELLFRTDVPVVTILTSQKLKPAGSAEIVNQAERIGNDRGDQGFRRATTAPNMMLTDA